MRRAGAASICRPRRSGGVRALAFAAACLPRRPGRRGRDRRSLLCRQDRPHRWSVSAPAAATTSMPARSPGISASTFPGDPAIVVQNMPGAGSLKVVNYLYNARAAGRHGARDLRARHGARAAARPPDGRAIRRAEIQLDRQRLQRSQRLRLQRAVAASRPGRTCMTKTIRDRRVRRRRRQRRVPDRAAQHVRAADAHRHRLSGRHRDGPRDGARRGRRPLRLVVDEHRVAQPRLLADKRIRCTLQIALAKHEDCRTSRWSWIWRQTRAAAALKLIVSRQSVARPFAAPPERAGGARRGVARRPSTPPCRTRTSSPRCAAHALEVRPVGGAEVQSLMRDIYASPSDVVQLARETSSGRHARGRRGAGRR